MFIRSFFDEHCRCDCHCRSHHHHHRRHNNEQNDDNRKQFSFTLNMSTASFVYNFFDCKRVFFCKNKKLKITLECDWFRHQLLLTNFAYTYAEYRNRWCSNDIRRTSCTITEGKNWFFFSIHYNNISMFYMENPKDRAVLNDRKAAIKKRERERNKKCERMGLFISFIDIMFSEPSLMINYASSQPNERKNKRTDRNVLWSFTTILNSLSRSSFYCR